MERATSAPVERVVNVVGVQFDILGNEEIRRGSCIDTDAGVINPETYENNEPKIAGLIDPRMGIMDQGMTCATCRLNYLECPGHFGHARFSEPVFNWGFLNHVKSVLSCICLQSGKLLVPKEVLVESAVPPLSPNPKKRFHQVKERCTTVRVSPYSGVPVPKLSVDIRKSTGQIQFIAEYTIAEGLASVVETANTSSESISETKKRVRQTLSAADCYHILRNISDEDCDLMGVPRPDNMIIRYFIVPPVAIRPSLRGDMSGQGGYMEHGTTHILANIVKINNRLAREKEKALVEGADISKNYGEYLDSLTYHVARYYDNESMSLPRSELKNSGKPLKSITARFKGGKTGRIRGNLQGKRVDYSARSVITSDPNNALDELGVPLKIAMTVTYPEVVTLQNLERLGQFVKNGSSTYPGANYIEDRTLVGQGGRYVRIDLKYREIPLQLGHIVHRHLVDGDVVLFNRQPSLHKMSMMAHRVRVINNPALITFRLNVTATKPYNADFDGDEMNMFVPQSEQARIELEMLADIKNHIISPKDSNPIVQLKQDSLVGAYKFTLAENRMGWREVMNLMAYTSVADGLIDGSTRIGKKDMSGIDVFSMIIPSRINYEGKGVLVCNGAIQPGSTLTVQQLGKKNSIPHLIMDSYGKHRTARFMDDVQRLTNIWLMQYSAFCIGFGDVFIKDGKTRERVQRHVETMMAEGQCFITENENNHLLDREGFEKHMRDHLDAVRNGAEITKELGNDNNLYVEVTSGAKGNNDNIHQIMGCLGQVTNGGHLIEKKLTRRSLPYFPREDDRPEARGFIRHGYVDGLSLAEYFYHSIDGRSGAIDTAIKTADTGYMQRKTIKATEDIYLAYDGTVRSANRGILQFVYGDSGYDSAKQMEVPSALIHLDDEGVSRVYGFTPEERKKYGVSSSRGRELVSDMVRMRDGLRGMVMGGRCERKTVPDKFYMPFNIARVIHYYSRLASKEKGGMTVEGVLGGLEALLGNDQTLLVPGAGGGSAWRNGLERTHKTLFSILLHEYLAPRRVMVEYRLTPPIFADMLKEMSGAYMRHLAEPGEMVGILAAQSIGEPLTQFTLNTFHHAGVASVMGANASAIDRFREIIHFTKNIKSAFMKVYLEAPMKYDEKKAMMLSAMLGNTALVDVAMAFEIHYRPDKGLDGVDTDPRGAFEFAGTVTSFEPWVIRVLLDREALMSHHVSLLMIKTQFVRFWNGLVNGTKGMKRKDKNLIQAITAGAIASTGENDPFPALHIRFEMKEYEYGHLQHLLHIVTHSFAIKGLPGVKRTVCSTENEWVFDKETGKAVERKEYVISVEGSNLNDVFYFHGVDKSRTYTNDVHSVLGAYGVEAVRTSILNETNTIFGTQSHVINHQHISILADIMTHTGAVTPVNRYGITKLDTDPLSRVSFEKSVDQLVQAAVFREEDTVTSVSSRIITGRVMGGGTGSMELVLDTQAIMETERAPNPLVSDVTTRTIVRLSGNPILMDALRRIRSASEEGA